MSNKKKKCKQCKKFIPVVDGVQLPGGFFCSIDSAVKFTSGQGQEKKERALKRVKSAKVKAVKDDQKRVKKKLNDLNREDLRWQHPKTQTAFNRMRVLEELKWFKDRGLEPVCISCGKANMDFCCGHLKTVGSSSALRYDRMNTRLQCNRYCNMGLSGNINGNKTTRGYLVGLVERFGEDEAAKIIEYCETNQSKVKKWTWQEVEEIRENAFSEIRKLEKIVN